MFVDCVVEALLLHANSFVAGQAKPFQNVCCNGGRVVPIVDLGDLAAPGKLRRVKPFEVAYQKNRLAVPWHDHAMILVITGSFISDHISDVLRPPHQECIETQAAHRLLQHIVSADIFLRCVR